MPSVTALFPSYGTDGAEISRQRFGGQAESSYNETVALLAKIGDLNWHGAAARSEKQALDETEGTAAMMMSYLLAAVSTAPSLNYTRLPLLQFDYP
jgi:hypothetical protein